MGRLWKTACCAAIASILACCLGACSGNADSQQGASASASAEPSADSSETLRADIEAKLAEARAVEYSNVSYLMRTETVVAGQDDTGAEQRQVVTVTMRGELDKSGETPAQHVAYEQTTNMKLEKTAYDMYINADGMIIKQGEQLMFNEVDDDMLQNSATSVTNIASEELVQQLLDIANSYDMKQLGDDTVITIVVDVSRLEGTTLVDTSSLPEGSTIATLVANFTIDDTNHFKAVRLNSSTKGAPTYRVDQSYQFSNYDSTELPEWPDLNAYIQQHLNIMTDAEGRQYIVDESGSPVYIEQ